MDGLDLDNIENLTMQQVDAAIHRTMDRLSRLIALSAAVHADDRRRIEALIQDYHRQKREERLRDDRAAGPDGSGS